MKAYLKGESSGTFEIEVNRRIYPNSSDYSDRNFLSASVQGAADGFNAFCKCNVRADEINIWIDKLRAFINGEVKQIQLENMEENLDIRGAVDLLGNVICECKIRKDSESRSPVLSFTIETSMLIIEEFRNALEQIMLQYPVLGSSIK